ncbi:MAG: DUF3105 domain-containing protein [Actinomycetota bacterium]
MAKKKRKQRHRPHSGPDEASGAAGAAATQTAERARSAKAERKDQARRARETELRRARRARTTRRAAWAGALGVGTFVALYLVLRVDAPKPIPDAALAAAEAAGCGAVQTPAASAPGGQHLARDEDYTYPDHPATSGFHDPSPLPPEPKVHTEPVPEIRAVHNLEHAYVLVYYRADGPDALAEDVVERLTSVAESENKVLMAPYPQLDEGTSLALAAWNKLWECPATVTADQAVTIASGFVEAYRGTGNAPEPRAG